MQKMFLTICALEDELSRKKDELTRALFKRANDVHYSFVLPCLFPHRPEQPDKPELLAPKHIRRRRISTGSLGRIDLLHAIAHIELNAIDLTLDIAGRYATYGLPFNFVRD